MRKDLWRPPACLDSNPACAIPGNPDSAMVRAVLLLIFGGIIKDPPFSRAARPWRSRSWLADDLWAVATVRSRAIPASTIKGMDPALGLLLIPGVDLATAVCNGGRRATAAPLLAQDHKLQLQQVAHMHLAKGACGVALEADGAWKCREEEEEGLEEGVGLCAVGG